jgi:hypothetical protein
MHICGFCVCRFVPVSTLEYIGERHVLPAAGLPASAAAFFAPAAVVGLSGMRGRIARRGTLLHVVRRPEDAGRSAGSADASGDATGVCGFQGVCGAGGFCGRCGASEFSGF